MGKWGVLKSISLEKITNPKTSFKNICLIFLAQLQYFEKIDTAFKMLSMCSLWIYFNFQVEVSPNFAILMHQSALGLFSPANFAANDLGLRVDGLICARIRHLWGWNKP